MMDSQLLGTILVALASGGAITAAIQWIQNRSKTATEAGSILVDGARALIEPLTARIDDLEERVRTLEEVERKHVQWAILNNVWPPDREVWEQL